MGVPLLGVPRISLENWTPCRFVAIPDGLLDEEATDASRWVFRLRIFFCCFFVCVKKVQEDMMDMYTPSKILKTIEH